jgi:hypothetical protein
MSVAVGVVWRGFVGFPLCTEVVVVAAVRVEITDVVGTGVLGLDLIIVLCSEGVFGPWVGFLD